MASKKIFQRIKKVRVSDTLVDQILSLIEDGTLEIGDQLPSERELVDQLGVSRATLREALRMLEFQGVIEVRPGKGAYVIDNTSSLVANQESVRQWFKEYADTILDMLEIREALERKAARMAAENASEESIMKIKATIEEASEFIGGENVDELVRLDRKFHWLVVDASGNTLLRRLVDILTDVMVSRRRSILTLPDRARASWTEHEAILEAIAARDPGKAEESMVQHIEGVRRAISSLG